MTIRPAAVADAAAVQSVARASWARAYAGIYPPDYIAAFLERAYSAASLEQAIRRDESDPERKFLVAEPDGAGVAGFIQLRRLDEETHELLRIYLLPSHQGAGLGTKLLLEAAARSRVRRLQAFVEGRNAPARAFYEARGFAVLRYETGSFAGHTSQLVVYERNTAGTNS